MLTPTPTALPLDNTSILYACGNILNRTPRRSPAPTC